MNKEKRIISVGYNGMPNKCPDKEMFWDKNEKGASQFKDKHLYGKYDPNQNNNIVELNNMLIESAYKST